jgi:hypothetical protein
VTAIAMFPAVESRRPSSSGTASGAERGADLSEASALAGEIDEARQLPLCSLVGGRDPLPFTTLVSSRAIAIMAPDADVPQLFATAFTHARGYGNAGDEGRPQCRIWARPGICVRGMRPSISVKP